MNYKLFNCGKLLILPLFAIFILLNGCEESPQVSGEGEKSAGGSGSDCEQLQSSLDIAKKAVDFASSGLSLEIDTKDSLTSIKDELKSKADKAQELFSRSQKGLKAMESLQLSDAKLQELQADYVGKLQELDSLIQDASKQLESLNGAMEVLAEPSARKTSTKYREAKTRFDKAKRAGQLPNYAEVTRTEDELKDIGEEIGRSCK